MVTATLAHCATFLKRLISNLLPFLSNPTQKFGGKIASASSFLVGDLDHLETTSYLGFVGGAGPTATANAGTYANGGLAIGVGSAKATGDATSTSVKYDVFAVSTDTYERSHAVVNANASSTGGEASANAFAHSGSYSSNIGGMTFPKP